MRRALGTAVLSAALITSACSSDDSSLFALGIPEADGAQSEILTIHLEDRTIVYAFDLSDIEAPVIEPIPTEAEPILIEAFLYPRPLVDMLVPPGRFEVDRGTGRMPPEGAQIFEAVLDGEPAWSARSQPSVRARIHPESNPCPAFSIDVIDSPTGAASIVAIGETSALIAHTVPQRIDVPAEGPATIREFVLDPPTRLDLREIIELGPNRFLFVNHGSELYDVVLQDELTLKLTQRQLNGGFDELDTAAGGEVNGRLELFASRSDTDSSGCVASTSSVADVYKLEGDTWSHVADVDGVCANGALSGSGWSGPGSAFFAWAGERKLLTYENGVFAKQEIPGVEHVLTYARYIDGIGRIVIDRGGHAHVDDGSGWRTIEPLEGTFQAATIARFRQGFMWGGPFGTLYTRESNRTCLINTGHHASTLLAFGDNTIIAAGVSPSTDTRRVSVIRLFNP